VAWSTHWPSEIPDHACRFLCAKRGKKRLGGSGLVTEIEMPYVSFEQTDERNISDTERAEQDANLSHVYVGRRCMLQTARMERACKEKKRNGNSRNARGGCIERKDRAKEIHASTGIHRRSADTGISIVVPWGGRRMGARHGQKSIRVIRGTHYNRQGTEEARGGRFKKQKKWGIITGRSKIYWGSKAKAI